MEAADDEFCFKRLTANTSAKVTQHQVVLHSKKLRTNQSNLFDGEIESQLRRPQARPTNKTKQPIKTVKNRADFSIDGFKVKRMNKSNNRSEIPNRKSINMDERIDLSTTSASSTDENQTLVMSYPVMKGTTKSYEIHKLINEQNVNKLIIECVRFLNINNEYSGEVIKYCSANYFSDINYKNEIETIENKTSKLIKEIERWKGMYTKKKKEREEAREIEKHKERRANAQDISKIFEEKAARMRNAGNKLKIVLEGIKEKSEILLKGIFTAVEEKRANPLFLLRAMSKLGDKPEGLARLSVE